MIPMLVPPGVHMCWLAGAVPIPCECFIGESHTDDDVRRLIAAIEGESVPALSGEEPEK